MSRFWIVSAVATLAFLSVIFQEGDSLENISGNTLTTAQIADGDYVRAAIASLNPEVDDPSCHSRWHDVGRDLGSKKYSLAQISAYENYDGCNWGLVHGFVEGAMRDVGKEEFVTESVRVCGTDLTERESVGNCLHGTGHAAWSASGKTINTALTLCGSLPVGGSDCADGVYMSLSDSIERGAWEGDALGVCDQTENAEFKSKCYRYSGHIWSRALGGDAAAMLDNCPIGERECGLGVGRALAYKGENASETVLNCGKVADKSVRDGCAQGVGEWFSLVRRTGQGSGDPSLVCEEMTPELYKEFGEACEIGEKQS